jgi:hypothetical protein
VAAVGEADADTSQNYFFAIGLFGWNEQKRHPQEIVVTHGTSEQIMPDLRDADRPRPHAACSTVDTTARPDDQAAPAGPADD